MRWRSSASTPRVLDCDYRLVGKARRQIHFLPVKGAHRRDDSITPIGVPAARTGTPAPYGMLRDRDISPPPRGATGVLDKMCRLPESSDRQVPRFPVIAKPPGPDSGKT